MKNHILTSRPTAALLEAELQWIDRQKQYRMLIQGTVCMLSTLAAAVFLAATLWLPVIQIYGNSMAPTLSNGDVLLCVKTNDLKNGDIAAFYHNNKLLVKRVIGCAGDQIDQDAEGNVSRNGILLSEGYIDAPSAGVTDISLPCQVPEGCFFVLGDHRSNSMDSRSSAVGFVPEDRVFGKALFQIWPLQRFGPISQKGG